MCAKKKPEINSKAKERTSSSSISRSRSRHKSKSSLSSGDISDKSGYERFAKNKLKGKEKQSSSKKTLDVQKPGEICETSRDRRRRRIEAVYKKKGGEYKSNGDDRDKATDPDSKHDIAMATPKKLTLTAANIVLMNTLKGTCL